MKYKGREGWERAWNFKCMQRSLNLYVEKRGILRFPSLLFNLCTPIPYFNCCFLSQNCKSCFISCVVANAVKRTKWSALKISQNLLLVSQVWVLIYLFFNMGDNVKCLRKANDNLKRQMQDLATDFQTFKNKMAE